MLGGPGGLHLSSLRQGGEQQPLVGHGPPSSGGGLSGGLSGPVLDPMPKGEASPMKVGNGYLAGSSRRMEDLRWGKKKTQSDFLSLPFVVLTAAEEQE